MEVSLLDGFDAKLENAGRDTHFHDVANLLVQQSLPDGRLDGNLSLGEVRLMWTDDGVTHPGIVVEIGHFDLAE